MIGGTSRLHRISFKKFLGLPLDKPAPDHSTFSRFRGRVSKEAVMVLNREVLREFSKRGLTIKEGIVIDARLVKSASRPMGKRDLRREKQRKGSEGGKGKEGEAVKFSRDTDSDWTVKNGQPHYGLKEHVSVDVEDGFVLGVTVTRASEHDSKYLPYLALASCYTEEPIKTIYADKGYFGQPNRSLLHLNDIEDGIMRGDTTTSQLTNAIPWNLWDSMCRQMTFNLFRGSKILAVT